MRGTRIKEMKLENTRGNLKFIYGSSHGEQYQFFLKLEESIKKSILYNIRAATIMAFKLNVGRLREISILDSII